MPLIRTLFLSFCAFMVLSGSSFAQGAEEALKRFDKDGNGQVSRGEWEKSGKPMKGFKKIDKNDDGILTFQEIEARFGGGRSSNTNQSAEPAQSSGAKTSPGNDRIEKDAIDMETLCAISRSKKCGLDLAIKHGLFETGLKPRFPDHLNCRGIDEAWAIDYTAVRHRPQLHGGIDMPAPWYTPMHAIADGEVVANYVGYDSYRGREIILRHSPQDTGIPLWIYSQYAHCHEQPKQQIGQRIKMGEILCPTGNTGRGKNEMIQSSKRRPAIHFAIWYSTSPQYFYGEAKIIPKEGRWMDPNALYRKKLPLDSYAMKALPEAEKQVPISVMVEGGELIPADTKIIWPYACSRK